MVARAGVPAFRCDEGIVVNDLVMVVGGEYVHVRTDTAGRVVVWQIEDTGIEPVFALGEPGDPPERISAWLHSLAFAVQSIDQRRELP